MVKLDYGEKQIMKTDDIFKGIAKDVEIRFETSK